MYDLIIIGGGPAGIAGGVYSARKKIKTALIADEIGGQSMVSDDIQNWIGTKVISGFDLAQAFKEHIKNYEDDIDIKTGEKVEKITEKDGGGFVIDTSAGESYETKRILLASGSHRRRLGIPGEAEFEGTGVVYCSTCDAPIFKGKDVAVVGGGNAGLEAVVDLLPYAEKIYLVVRSEGPKGDAVTLEKVKASDKTEIITEALSQEILGDKMVTGLKYLDKKNDEIKELEVGGVFVEIGSVPNSDIVKGLVDINERGEVVVDHKTQASSNPGIWAAGDVSDVLYKQNNVSAGDAIKAVLNIYEKMVRETKN